MWNNWLESLSLGNKGAHDLCFDGIRFILWSYEPLMHSRDVLGELHVKIGVSLVQEQENQIESRKQSC